MVVTDEAAGSQQAILLTPRCAERRSHSSDGREQALKLFSLSSVLTFYSSCFYIQYGCPITVFTAAEVLM